MWLGWINTQDSTPWPLLCSTRASSLEFMDIYFKGFLAFWNDLVKERVSIIPQFWSQLSCKPKKKKKKKSRGTKYHLSVWGKKPLILWYPRTSSYKQFKRDYSFTNINKYLNNKFPLQTNSPSSPWIMGSCLRICELLTIPMQKRIKSSSHGMSVQLRSSSGFHSRLEL